jgi:hypothetical protein
MEKVWGLDLDTDLDTDFDKTIYMPSPWPQGQAQLDPYLFFMVYKELRIRMEFTALSKMTTTMDRFEMPLIPGSSAPSP